MNEVMYLEARMKNYLSPELQKITESLNKNKKSVEKLKDSHTNLGISTKQLFQIFGGYTIIHKMNSLMRESVTLINEQSDADQKLRQVIKSTGGAAGVTFEEMQKLSVSLQGVTTVSDSVIERGTAMLLSFTNISKEILPQTTETMLNLSTAMGVDVKESAIQLGKALNDPITGVTALRRVGVMLNNQQELQIKKLVESGKLMEAQKLILDELQVEFGGLARAMAESDTGKIKQINNMIDDQKELLGKDLLPLIYEWQKLLLDISKTPLETITDALKGWTWLLGGSKETQDKLKEMNTVNKEMQELIQLRKQWLDVETRLSTLKNIGAYFNPDELLQAKNNIDAINESLNKLSNKGTIKQTGKKTGLIITDEMIKEAEEKEKEIKKIIEDIDKDLFESKKESLEDLKKLSLEFDKEKIDKEIEYNKQILTALDSLDAERILGIEDKNKQELALLKDKHRKELDEYEKNEEAKSIIIQKQQIETANLVKKQQNEQIKIDQKASEDKIDNMQYVADSTFQIAGNITKATKASANAQKVIDIAQATANMALGITKAAATPATMWMIPLITTIGATQIALIASQKYAGGGIVPGTGNTDSVPAMLTPREMILNNDQQSNLFNLLSRPNQNNNYSSVSNNDNSAVNLHIHVGNNSNYDMNAARLTADQLVPVIGDALIKAKNGGYLRNYESAR